MPTLAELQNRYNNTPLPMESEANTTECLEFDARSHLRPVDLVEQKLKSVLRRGDFGSPKKAPKAGRRTAK